MIRFSTVIASIARQSQRLLRSLCFLGMTMMFFIVTAFAQATLLTPQKFADILSQLSCEPYAFSSEVAELHKSDVVLEIEKILNSKGTQFPPDWKTIRFRDAGEEDVYFIAAQKIASLGGIELGQFGNQTTKNPLMSESEAKELLNKIFDQSKCEFTLNIDRDKDGVYNYNDTCPDVPARGSENGCPTFDVRPYSRIEKEGVQIQVPFQETGLRFYEQTQIKLGDVFRVVVRSPKTGEILSESDPIEVKN